MTRHHVSPVWIVLTVAILGCQGSSPKATSDEKGVMMPRAPLADVLKTRTPELLKIEGVTGTGEAQESGEPVFVIYVTQDTPELRAKLPVAVDDYRVVIRAAGEVRADGH